MSQAAEILVESWLDGASFLVKAHPGARREALSGSHAGMLKAEVTAAPERGKANQALIRLLARELGVPPSELILLQGDAGTRKRFGVKGLAPKRLSSKLAEILERNRGSERRKT
jgi:uncharacterized protein YggU (UPF0235/DUF167 family)